MSNNFPPFHLAFPVKNLLETKLFYTNFLGCTIGRASNKWIDFNFYGHQITAHLSPESCDIVNNNKVDEKIVPVRHFGLIMDWDDWHIAKNKLIQKLNAIPRPVMVLLRSPTASPFLSLMFLFVIER